MGTRNAYIVKCVIDNNEIEFFKKLTQTDREGYQLLGSNHALYFKMLEDSIRYKLRPIKNTSSHELIVMGSCTNVTKESLTNLLLKFSNDFTFVVTLEEGEDLLGIIHGEYYTKTPLNLDIPGFHQLTITFEANKKVLGYELTLAFDFWLDHPLGYRGHQRSKYTNLYFNQNNNYIEISSIEG